MTKDIAYKVFGLEPDASKEEIQKAYAELSKKYHPEEKPEEFQRIHEAYTMLIRGNRTRRQSVNRENTNDFQSSIFQEENVLQNGQFQNIPSSEQDITLEDEQGDVPKFDFDSAERKVQQEFYLREVQTAMNKLDDIIGIIMKKSINSIILKEQLEKLPMEIRMSPQYIGKLYTILKDRFVDDEAHEVLTEQLHLWDEGLLENYEHIAGFKDFIDQKKVEYWLPEVRNKRVLPLKVVIVGAILLAVFCFLKVANLI